MSSDLMRYSGDPGRRGELARPTRRQRAVIQRAELDRFDLVHAGQLEEVKAMFRKRLTEDAMQDIKDVGELARELAAGDEWIASLLIPIAQEFARTTARDIRDFGRGRAR